MTTTEALLKDIGPLVNKINGYLMELHSENLIGIGNVNGKIYYIERVGPDYGKTLTSCEDLHEVHKYLSGMVKMLEITRDEE